MMIPLKDDTVSNNTQNPNHYLSVSRTQTHREIKLLALLKIAH